MIIQVVWLVFADMEKDTLKRDQQQVCLDVAVLHVHDGYRTGRLWQRVTVIVRGPALSRSTRVTLKTSFM